MYQLYKFILIFRLTLSSCHKRGKMKIDVFVCVGVHVCVSMCLCMHVERKTERKRKKQENKNQEGEQLEIKQPTPFMNSYVPVKIYGRNCEVKERASF